MKFPYHLGVISHKELYVKDGQYHTDGGFPRQMEALSKLFQEVTICAPARRGTSLEGLENLSAKGLLIEPLPCAPAASICDKLKFLFRCPYFVWRIWRFSRRVDVIQIRIPNYIGVLGALVMQWQRKPTMVWLGGNWWERILSGGKSLHRRMVAAFIRWLVPRLMRKDWVVFVPNSRIVSQVNFRAPVFTMINTSIWAHEVQSEVCVPKNNHHLSLLYVGRLSPEKGPDVLIESLQFIKDLSLSLTVVGDGPLRSKLEKRVHSLKLTEQVYFAGKVSRNQVSKYYSKSDILVVPSLNEMSPKVILEGMSHGLAVVASRVGAIPQLLSDGRGILVEPGNKEDLAAAIRTLAEDKDCLRVLSQRGLDFARQNTLDKLNDLMAEVFKSHWGLEVERQC